MKFALVNDDRTEPFPKLVGACPHCGGQVIAKCGQIKIHHWAHKGGLKRDCKWEQETQWHRDWKNKFPDDWQEYSQRDENNELHIADVFTPDGLALEFQHSPIDRREVEARTKFYKNICWIVDGLRLKTGLKRFQRALRIGFVRNFDGINIHKIFAQDFSLLEQWARL